ncbi:MAG: hypothetical protein O3A21_00730, partial [Proteobacteria bacterium]|nr:hypothetical protein [Pseudomonadota bacterium]
TDVSALREAAVVAALAELGKHAAAGAPSAAALAAQLSAQAGAIVNAAKRDDSAGWVAQTIDRVASVVRVRRVGDVGGASVEARVARAELRSAAGDLSAAVAELSDLPERAAAAAAAWLDKARTRLAIDSAAAIVYEASARALSTGGAGE